MTAIVLVFGSVHLLMADGAKIARDNGPTGEAALVREQIAQLGAGAEVKLKLRDGTRLKGEIGDSGAEEFTLQQGGGSSKAIGFGDVTEVRLAKLNYKASGQPDPAAVRRVVMALGPGKHVAVKTLGGATYRGHIRKASDGEFTLLPDQAASEVAIAYADVTQVGKNLSPGGTIAVLVAVVAAVLIVAMVLNKDETPKVRL